MLARGVNIGGKQGQQKDDEAKGSQSCGKRDEQADGADNFEDARDGDEQRRLRKNRWHHANQVWPAFSPMSGSGDQEHQRKGDGEWRIPMIECTNAKKSDGAKDDKGNEKHDQGNHFSAVFELEDFMSADLFQSSRLD